MAMIRIGTSGWHYRHWEGVLYPPGTASGEFLGLYAKQFDSVEINATHYRLPEAETLANWRDSTGPDFVFSCKASRYITHMKKLKEPRKTTQTFLEAVSQLEPKLGPVLFQLPPRWHVNPDRLSQFLRALPKGFSYVFEFRDPGWYSQEVLEMLQAKGAALCIHDHEGSESPICATADFVYVRLHGPATGYRGSYTRPQLAAWAERISGWQGTGKDVYCYFNNDAEGHAVRNALRLRKLAGGDIRL